MNQTINRRNFIKTTSTSLATLPFIINKASAQKRPPNIVLIFCDDLGYGDIGCFGSELHRTPHIDKMAEEGLKLTSFYVTSGVCTPSRSSLLTGCYPRRVNMHEDGNRLCVLFPVGNKGLNPNEQTIAEVLKQREYATACIGKWHLGDQPEFLPTRQGFDYYYGIPYSNDMGEGQGPGRPPLPLLRNETVVEAPVDQTTITKRYTEEAVNFIENNQNKPFFIYLPHTMPHNPVNSSEQFKGKSKNNGYGDCVEEIDWSTGQIIKALKDNGLDENTLVIFTSDNGAAKKWGGNNGPLRGWKGSTWEGGMRVSCVMRWPGVIEPGTESDAMTSTIDLLPTFAGMADAPLPSNRKIDGKDISAILKGEAERSPHEVFYFYQMDQLQAVRSGRYKVHLPLEDKKRNWGPSEGPVELALYDLKNDIAESKDVSKDHPKVVDRLLKLADMARQDIGDTDHAGANQRPAGWVEEPEPLTMKE